ncbi:MAG: ACT domain-containing protein [Lachnospiraceae bacterium]|nr:ACT domain-containing protein [Lachnospiraceae bacterium]
MYINQISVFVENKPGNLAALTEFIAKHNIDLRAFTLVDSTDYGIVRIIVKDAFDTITLLKDNDWICKLTKVIGVKLPDKPGAMATIMGIMAKNNINVDYAYAFVAKGTTDALMVFKVNESEAEKASAVLSSEGLKVISPADLESM